MAAVIVPLGVSEFPFPLRSISEAIETPLAVASAKISQGGTAPMRVNEQLEKAKKILFK